MGWRHQQLGARHAPVLIVLTVVVLAGAYWAARPEPRPVRWGIFSAFALPAIILPTAIDFFPTVVVVLTVCLAAALWTWPAVRPRIRTFLPLAALSVAVAYGLACAVAMNGTARFERLREKYPYESMEGRVAAPRTPARGPPATAVDGQLGRLESDLGEYRHGLRELMLRQLHEEQAQQFASSPGFGVARMWFPSHWGLRLRERPNVPVQPLLTSPPGDRAVARRPTSRTCSLMRRRHSGFVNPLVLASEGPPASSPAFNPTLSARSPDSAVCWRVSSST